MTEPTTAAVPEKAGLWEDFIDILHKPSAVFERRRDGKFGLALLVLIVIMGVLYFALRNGMGPIVDAEMSRQMADAMEKNPQITEEQLSGMRSMFEIFGLIGPVIFLPIGVLIGGFLLWLAGKILDAKVVFTAAMMIATYSQVPRILELVINAVQGLFLPPESITSRYSVTIGVARFLDQDAHPVASTVFAGLDLFTIWTVVLTAIGVAVVARVSMKRGAAVASAVWAVSMLPVVIAALRQ